MTIKQKFSSIDQSKLTADQKSFLDKIKNVTKNFTDAEMNKKVEAPLDNFIAKAKDKMPEAIKSAPVKRTAKAKTSQTRKPNRTAMSLAKEIRKEGESWKDAQVRARKMMKEDSQSLSKTVESELDKLSKLVKSEKTRSKLAGISGTDIKRDAVRKAKPRGARKVTHSGETSNQYGTFSNKLGRKYYESRDRHSDRLAPNYPKNAPLLESGAYLTDGTFGNFQNQVFEEGGDIDAFTLRMVKSNGMQPAEVLKEDANVKYAGGGFFSSGRPKSALMRDRKNVNHSEDYEVRYSKPRPSRTGYSGNRRFELGGVMTTDLAGHTGGGDAGLNAGMPLDGFSNTGYTGLVGETGAMSSGEMFMAGGKVDKNFNLAGYKRYRMFDDFKDAKDHVDMDRKKYPYGKKSVVIKKGDRYEVWSEPVTGIETGERVYELGGGLPQGSSQSYMITEALGNPAQHFNNGGGVDYYEQLAVYVQGVGSLYNGTSMKKAINVANSYHTKNPKAEIVIVDEKYGDEYDFNGNLKESFAKGGSVTNERRYVNKAQDYEVRYSKPRPHRKGYDGKRDFNTGGAITNERKHVNHDEDYEVRYAKPRPKRKGYKGARKFMAGGSMETPRIYVADLEAYNNGRLVGEWLDLADYNDADKLMDAIQDVLKKSGGEEYAIHDYENFPRSMYSEYMSKNDFEVLYEVMETAKRYDLPLEVVEEIVSQYGEGGVDEFQGKYDNAEDFAIQLVDDIGIESFIDYEYYLSVSETDRRLLSQEMADTYVDDIRNEDGGNRLIDEAGMDVEKYEEADSEMQEEMLDKAREIVYDEYYNNFYEGLDDPKNFLVDEQGLYDTESFAKADFVRVDYEKLADALEQDYTFIEHDGDLYVFNIR